jgi:hypothetical protein
MRMHRLPQVGAHPRPPTDEVDRFTREGLHRVGPWKEPQAGLRLPPILPQEAEQLRREHDVAVLLAFALPDAQYHARTVDIRDMQVTQFRDREAGGIERSEDGPVGELTRRLQERCHFGRAQQGGQRLGPLRVGNKLNHPGLLECDAVEEAERTDNLDDTRPGEVPFLDKIELILADMLGAEAVRWGPEILGEVGHTAQIAVDRQRRIVAQVQVVMHALAQSGHGGTGGLHGLTPSTRRQERYGVASTPRRLWRSHCEPGQAEMAR